MVLELPIMTKVLPVVMAGLFYLSTAIPVSPGWWEGHSGDYRWEGKVYDSPSSMGINSGRGSKLTVKKNGKVVAHYDRGWDVVPGKEDQQVVDEIVNKFPDKK